MVLKPSSIQVALVEELIDGATSDGKYDELEKKELQQFREQLTKHGN